jgi:TonB-linked SusC/RagA family outer membrane protein
MRYLKIGVVLTLAALAAPEPALGAAAWPAGEMSLQQAQHQVRGLVTSAEANAPLANVTVRVKGTGVGTITNAGGRFQVTAPSPNDTLVFQSVGFRAQEVAIDGRAEVNVTLQTAAFALDELVVTGYQVQRRGDITGSVAVVDLEEVRRVPQPNVMQAVQGRVPGVTITGDGSPFGGAQVRIRGTGTLGNNDPLYVIDGVPSKTDAVQRLNSNDIESMQILRDAAAASIYGSRASNGVVVITTRRARTGQLRVEYNGDMTASTHVNRIRTLNAEERGRALWQAAINDGRDPNTLPIYSYDWSRRPDGAAVLNRVIMPEYVGNPAAGIRAADTDWYDEISRTGMIQNHNVAATVGTDRGGALLSLGFHGNEAIVRNQDFQRFTARINSDYRFFDGRLTIGENFTISSQHGTPMPSGLGGNPMWLSLIVQPIIPVRTEDGTGWGGPLGAGFDDRDNPVRLLEHNAWDQAANVHTFGNVFATASLATDLLWTSRFGMDWRRGSGRDIQRRYQSGFLSRNVNSVNFSNDELFEVTASSTLDYTRTMGGHRVNLLSGIEALQHDYRNQFLLREEFAIESPEYFIPSAGTGRQDLGGGRTGFSLLSYFGRATYNFRDRYTASFTGRLDGSSRFGEENRFGFFPSLSLGWRVGEEAFFRDNVGFVSDLFLRASVGVNGNQEIGNEARFSLFVPRYGEDNTWGPGNGTAYDIAGQVTGNLPAGFLRVQAANPALRWEETTETNLGLDFGLLDDRVRGSFDAFQRRTDGILMNPPYLASIGDGGSQWQNGATVEVRGFEATLGYRTGLAGFSLNVDGNLGAYRDRITHLPESVVRAWPGNEEQNILGRSMHSLFGYVAEGIFQNQAEVAAHAEQTGKGVGRIRFADLNGDGVVNALDQTWLGTTAPDFEYGLTLGVGRGGINTRLFFQGRQGVQVRNDMRTYTDFTGIWTNANNGRRVLEAWTPENPGSTIPALSLNNNNWEDRPSTYFIEDGSFFKLRDAEVSYTLPERWNGMVGAQSATLYARGQNLFTVRHPGFTGPDPENPGLAFPHSRNLTVGVSMSF